MSTQGSPTWQSVKPNFITFENEGDEVIGYLISLDYVDMKTGAVPKYTLNSADGPVSFLGTVQMVETLSRIPFGTLVRLIFLGLRTTQGSFKVKDFDIQVAVGEDGRVPEMIEGVGSSQQLDGQMSLLPNMQREPTGYNAEAVQSMQDTDAEAAGLPPGGRGKGAAAGKTKT